MSGHSKWSTIKRKKAATDSKRAKIFTKLLKEVQVAARIGGGSLEANFRLKTAVSAAKSMSVPNDSIDKAIKRGAGGGKDDVDYEENTYEGYGPAGVALIVKTMTDNRNRTASEVRSTFGKYGGNLGSANSVAYLFTEKGIITLPKDKFAEDEVFSIALDNGAEDVSDEGDVWEVITPSTEFEPVKNALDKLADKINSEKVNKNNPASKKKDEDDIVIEGELRLIPATMVPVSGKDAESLMKLIEVLEDLDDVQSVTGNFELDQESLDKL